MKLFSIIQALFLHNSAHSPVTSKIGGHETVVEGVEVQFVIFLSIAQVPLVPHGTDLGDQFLDTLGCGLSLRIELT